MSPNVVVIVALGAVAAASVLMPHAKARRAKRDFQLLLREIERRLDDDLDFLTDTPWTTESELQFRDVLAGRLANERELFDGERELVLSTNSRVDFVATNMIERWFLTVKKGAKNGGFGNQQRLVLQGEVEDILRTLPEELDYFRIVVLVGLPSTKTDNQTKQLARLEAHLAWRLAGWSEPEELSGRARGSFSIVTTPITGGGHSLAE